MKKYFVENGRVVINKYCVEYSYHLSNGNTETNYDVCQYIVNDGELESLTSELERKNIEFAVVEMDIKDIACFDGIPADSYEDARKIIEPTLEEVKADKIKEISAVCERKIYNGIDVEFGSEIKHFSLKIEDQLNINRLAFIFGRKEDGEGIIYHADGELCEKFSKEDFFKIVDAASDFISSETEYCNRLMKYTEGLENVKDVFAVFYGFEI